MVLADEPSRAQSQASMTDMIPKHLSFTLSALVIMLRSGLESGKPRFAD